MAGVEVATVQCYKCRRRITVSEDYFTICPSCGHGGNVSKDRIKWVNKEELLFVNTKWALKRG